MFFLTEAGRATNGTAWKRAKERKTRKHKNTESALINQHAVHHCRTVCSKEKCEHSVANNFGTVCLVGKSTLYSQTAPKSALSHKKLQAKSASDPIVARRIVVIRHLVPSTSLLWGAPYLWCLKREGTPVPTALSSFGGTGVSSTLLLRVF